MNKLYKLQVIGGLYTLELFAPSAEIAIQEAWEYRGFRCVVLGLA